MRSESRVEFKRNSHKYFSNDPAWDWKNGFGDRVEGGLLMMPQRSLHIESTMLK